MTPPKTFTWRGTEREYGPDPTPAPKTFTWRGTDRPYSGHTAPPRPDTLPPSPPEPNPETFTWRGIERPWSVPLTTTYLPCQTANAWAIGHGHIEDPNPPGESTFIWRGKDRSPRTYQAIRHGHLMTITGKNGNWAIHHGDTLAGHEFALLDAKARADDYAKSLPKPPRQTKQRNGWHEIK